MMRRSLGKRRKGFMGLLPLLFSCVEVATVGSKREGAVLTLEKEGAKKKKKALFLSSPSFLSFPGPSLCPLPTKAKNMHIRQRSRKIITRIPDSPMSSCHVYRIETRKAWRASLPALRPTRRYKKCLKKLVVNPNTFLRARLRTNRLCDGGDGGVGGGRGGLCRGDERVF